MRFLLIPILLVLTLSGCNRAEKEARKNDLRAMMHGLTNDPDIQAAMEKAKATTPEFLAVLQKPAANQRQFLVRKVFPAQDVKQQILWINDLTYDGTLLHGKVDDNTSKPGSGVAPDGKVSFPPSEICDWMYNEDGKAVGGFMLRASKTKMTPKEWAAIERQITFKE